MTGLKTYRTEGVGDSTTWAYQNSTGLLTSKTYADAAQVQYSYDSANRLATRTWARVTEAFQPVVSSYSYNLAGDLTGIDYSDTTPDISYTYNRLGQQKTVNDVVGTRTFAYNSALQLTSETIDGSSGGLYSKTINRSYETSGVIGRYTGVNIGAEYDVDYGYDTYGRLSSVVCPLSSETFTYSYLPNSNLVSGITYPNNISVTKSYEPNRDLVTLVANKYSTTTISQYGYTYDDLGRRQDMAKSGTAFSASDTINYGYNDKSEVTSAIATNDTNYNCLFDFDPIGNRLTSSTTETGSTVTSTYTSNSLNQYTAIDNPSQSPTYDDDGNTLALSNDGVLWNFTWDAENRLIAAEKSGQRLEFKYDYLSRRVEKRVLDGGSETSKERFVYDGFLQVEKLDALDGNAILRKRIWGAEGKIIADIHPSGTYYALGDANKNITEYIDASGTVQGHFEFSPFGKITVASGPMADDFDFRFSSEYYDQETGLVYYNYRYYSPELGRWLSRDPLGEVVARNLYGMVGNNPINKWDYLGNDMSDDIYRANRDRYDEISEKYTKKQGRFKMNVPLIGTSCSVLGEHRKNYIEYYITYKMVNIHKGDWCGKILAPGLFGHVTQTLDDILHSGVPPEDVPKPSLFFFSNEFWGKTIGRTIPHFKAYLYWKNEFADIEKWKGFKYEDITCGLSATGCGCEWHGTVEESSASKVSVEKNIMIGEMVETEIRYEK